MEIFNVHRKDVHSFDNFMDLKKPGFGGPMSAIRLKDRKGNDVNSDRKLKEYQRTVKRDVTFNSQAYDSTYKAMGGDLVYKQEVGKNPYDYKDTYDTMGIPTTDVSKANEGLCYTNFSLFILESNDDKEDVNDEDTEDDELEDECENCK